MSVDGGRAEVGGTQSNDAIDPERKSARRRHAPSLVNVSLALDLDLHSRIDQSLHLDERGGRQIFAEIRYAARVDFRSFRDVGHENLHLDDMLGPGARRLQALVHYGDGDVELGNNVGRDAAVLRLATDASDPDVGTCAGHVTIVADWLRDVWNDDALDFWHVWLANGIDAQRLAAVGPVGQHILRRSRGFVFSQALAGPSRHFAAMQRSGRFRTGADVRWQAAPVGSVENDP